MQVLKDDVKKSIIEAALTEFSTKGVPSTSMAKIAKEAGISTGNIYRYFSSKEVLFDEAIPHEFVSKVKRDIKNVLISAIGVNKDDNRFVKKQNWQDKAESLLLESVENRKRLIVILDRAQGTPLSGLREELIAMFVSHAIKYAKSKVQDFKISKRQKTVLRLVYSSLLTNTCEILRTAKNPNEAYQLLQDYRMYHLNGLEGFFNNKLISE